MKKIMLYLSIMILVTQTACRNDETYKQTEKPSGPTAIELDLTGRVGTVIDASLTDYIESLNLLLFREVGNRYILYRQVVLNKEQLKVLTDGGVAESGFTTPKKYAFDTVPISSYKVVGVGNILDSLGNAMSDVKLNGLVEGAEMSQILATLVGDQQSPRLFMGMTGVIQIGAPVSSLPRLRLYRRISMFALSLEKIPDLVNRIDMEIGNTYGSFDMTGMYTFGSEITVFASNQYTQQVQDSITLTYITLPTIVGVKSTFKLTFYLQNGGKQNVELPKYVLKRNAITKLTATIDVDQPDNIWKVNLDFAVSVETEWNVDQEPPITI